MKEILRNLKRKDILKAQRQNEPFARRTVSFYRYFVEKSPKKLRNKLFREWKALRVLGRTYVSAEGINAQVSVPVPNWQAFKKMLFAHKNLKEIPFKVGLSEHDPSFERLTIKIKEKIVADGLEADEIDLENIGQHIKAGEMNAAIAKAKQHEAVIVDMRNHYEFEVGHFETAVCPNTETFREALPKAVDLAKDFKEKEVVLYCTGGIRCEKASAYFRAHGFEHVKQLHGGIIDYKHQIDEKKLENTYKGKNFVFDGRTAEKVSDEVVSFCHQCGQKADTHVNCGNDACHLLFIQCGACQQAHGAFCGPKCQAFARLPREEQIKQRKKDGAEAKKALNVYARHQKRDLMNIWG